MAKKLKQDEIKKEDVERYIEENSDFRFEMQVLNELNCLGYDCEHGGQYIDPYTKKSRQFDIKAQTDLANTDSE